MTTTTCLRRNFQVDELPPNLPGADLIEAGIAALDRGERTIEALLVALAAERLREIGLTIPQAADYITAPNLALYAAVRHNGGGHFRVQRAARALIELCRRRRVAASHANPSARARHHRLTRIQMRRRAIRHPVGPSTP